MKNPDTRERVKKRLKEINQRPSVRGGNGRGLTKTQVAMLEALKACPPVPEYAIPTKIPRGNGYPTNYKVDLAYPEEKIAIEITIVQPE